MPDDIFTPQVNAGPFDNADYGAHTHRELAEARAERDHWIRLFNRLDAAINHHSAKRRSGHEGFGPDENDDALYAAQQRILRDAGNIDRPKQPGGPRRNEPSS